MDTDTQIREIFERLPIDVDCYDPGTLAEIALPAIPLLIEALKHDHEDREVCKRAAKTLGIIGDRSAVPALVEALYVNWRNVGDDAAEALGKIKDASLVPTLLELLKSQSLKIGKSAAVNLRATYVLGEIGELSVLPLIIEALASGVFAEYKHIYRTAIGKIGGIATYIEMMQSENSDLRYQGLLGIVELEDVLTLPILIKTLKDKESELRESSACFLGSSGNIQAVIPLTEALKEKNRSFRWGVARALKDLGDEKTLPRKILAALHLSVHERLEALDALRDAYYEADSPHTEASQWSWEDLWDMIKFYSGAYRVPYKFPNTRRFCQIVLNEEDADARQGAQEMLDFLDGDTFLRASQANSETEKDELLRGARGDDANSEANSLLRPFDAILTETNKPASIWKCLFGKRDN